MKKEAIYLGVNKSFSEFFRNLPKKDLMAQLFHFSNSYSQDEAIENLENIEFFSYVDKLNDSGYKKSEETIPSIHLPLGKVRNASKNNYKISSNDLDDLRELLEKEYKFLNSLKF